MKVIIGLGNPGKKYEQTRHNIGFKLIDELSGKWDVALSKTKFKATYGIGFVGSEKVCLIKPLTYMNLSGEAIRPLLDYYETPVEDMLVIYDDLDLPTGKIRLRQKGSAGGHNGMKSIITHVGTTEFKRIRIGIDRPEPGSAVVDYVLKTFRLDQQEDAASAISLSVAACDAWLSTPFPEVMNRYNQ